MVLVREPYSNAKLSCAKRWGKESLLNSFHPTYLDKVIETASGKCSNEEIVRRLVLALDARKEVHDIERNMDKALFEKIITGGSFMLSGKERGSQRPVMWCDVGGFNRGCWRYKRGTQTYNAHLRAQLWMLEVAEHSAARNGFIGQVMICSGATQRNLDFNLGLLSHCSRLGTQQFPFTVLAKDGFTVRVAGSFPGISTMNNMVAKFMGMELKDTFGVIDYEDATDMVKDARDIPEFWYDDGNGKFFDDTSVDVETTWCYKRCMSEENKLSLQEVLSPVECLTNLENEPLSTPCKKEKQKDILEPISEEDEEDDV